MPTKEQNLHMFTLYTNPSAASLYKCSELGPNVTYSLVSLNHRHQMRIGLVMSLGFQGTLQVPDEYTHFIFCKRKKIPFCKVKKTIHLID